MGLKQPCTGEVIGVAHTLDNAWQQIRGINHSTASDMLGFKTTLGDTRIA